MRGQIDVAPVLAIHLIVLIESMECYSSVRFWETYFICEILISDKDSTLVICWQNDNPIVGVNLNSFLGSRSMKSGTAIKHHVNRVF